MQDFRWSVPAPEMGCARSAESAVRRARPGARFAIGPGASPRMNRVKTTAGRLAAGFPSFGTPIASCHPGRCGRQSIRWRRRVGTEEKAAQHRALGPAVLAAIEQRSQCSREDAEVVDLAPYVRKVSRSQCLDLRTRRFAVLCKTQQCPRIRNRETQHPAALDEAQPRNALFVVEPAAGLRPSRPGNDTRTLVVADGLDADTAHGRGSPDRDRAPRTFRRLARVSGSGGALSGRAREDPGNRPAGRRQRRGAIGPRVPERETGAATRVRAHCMPLRHSRRCREYWPAWVATRSAIKARDESIGLVGQPKIVIRAVAAQSLLSWIASTKPVGTRRFARSSGDATGASSSYGSDAPRNCAAPSCRGSRITYGVS